MKKGDRSTVSVSAWRLNLFRLIMVLFPLLILACLELIFIVAGIGKEIPLFVEDPGNSEYLMMNPRIAMRYFLDPDAAPAVQYPSFRKEKPENAIRVVVQGASTVAGIPYKKGGAFPAMLEHQLRSSFPGKAIEVINTGITAVCSYTLLDLAGEIAEISPDAVIVYAGHNEYYGVLGAGSSQGLGRNNSLIRFYHSMSKLRLVRVTRKIHGGIAGRRTAELISKPNSTLMERMVKEQEIPFSSDLYEQGVDQFSVNLTRMAETYRKRKIPLFFCTLVSNEKDLEPFISDDPYYSLGQQYYRDGNYENAREQFILASDYDLLRFRAPSEFNGIIREIAEEQHAQLIDVRQFFVDHSPHGIIGGELLTEHVHPNIKGYSLISKACFAAMESAGIVSKGKREGPEPDFTVDLPVTEVDSIYGEIGITMLKSSWPFQEKGITPERMGELFSPENFMDSLAWDLFLEKLTWEETMNTLFYHYLAQGDFPEALRVTGALKIELRYSAIPYNMAGRVYSEQGRLDRAARELKMGFDLEPIPQLALNLGNMLIRTGKTTQSIPYLKFYLEAEPEHTDVLKKLNCAREIEHLKSQVNSHPDSTELLIHLAYQYLFLHQQAYADSLVSQAFQQDPENNLLKQIFSAGSE